MLINTQHKANLMWLVLLSNMRQCRTTEVFGKGSDMIRTTLETLF